MAGLGGNVGTNFFLRARMSGTAIFNGEQAIVWYFTDGKGSQAKGFMGDRYLPSSHIEPIEGRNINLRFGNQSEMPHTIHLHGLDVDQANDGVGETSLVIPPFESHTYRFRAPHAGTYHYHCHVDTVVHYHRGMAGTVIVRPPDGSTNLAWKGGPVFDEEVLWHLSTYDMSWDGINYSGSQTARHHPDVFLLNGKQTAEAMTDPYTVVNVGVGDRAYVRVLNSAFQWGRVSLGGLPFQVVASDGRPMNQPVTAEAWEIGPGERYDLYFQPTEPGAVDATVQYLDDYTGSVLGEVATRITVT